MIKTKPARIMIVEDETIIAEDLKTFLEDSGYEIIGVVNSGREALELHEQLNPDLVVMDIVLDEEMNGIEAANKMQENCSTPILFLTALKYDVVVKNLKNIDFFIHLMKPFKDSDLITSIEKMLKANGMDQEETILINKMKQLLNYMPFGIVILAENGNVTYTNKMLDELCGTSYNRMLSEALYHIDSSDKEKHIHMEISDKEIPFKVRSVDLNWDSDYKKMLILREISQEVTSEKQVQLLKQHLKILEKKFHVGKFTLEFNDEPKIIEVNPELINKLKFKQYSDIHQKFFSELFPDKKSFQLLLKKLKEESSIFEFKTSFSDQNNELVNAVIDAEIVNAGDGINQIRGRVYFQD